MHGLDTKILYLARYSVDMAPFPGVNPLLIIVDPSLLFSYCLQHTLGKVWWVGTIIDRDIASPTRGGVGIQCSTKFKHLLYS